MQQHGSKNCARRHTLEPGGWGQKVKTFFFFSESSHVEYQTKGNGE